MVTAFHVGRSAQLGELNNDRNRQVLSDLFISNQKCPILTKYCRGVYTSSPVRLGPPAEGIMRNLDKWRANANKALAGPVRRRRDTESVTGKVEDRVEEISAARSRGMPWKDIAHALEDGAVISADAVESAFKRICAERGIRCPGRRAGPSRVPPPKVGSTVPVVTDHPNLFAPIAERWVDDGE